MRSVRRQLNGPTLALTCYLAGRLWQVAALESPLSYSDTPMYMGSGRTWLDLSSVSLLASALAIVFSGYAWIYNANIDKAWGDWLGVPGLNGRVLTQYRIASETRLDPDHGQSSTPSARPARSSDHVDTPG